MGGLKLAGAKRLWQALYDNVPRPVDCHLCVGLNDVIHLARLTQAPGLTAEEENLRKVEVFMSRVEDIYNVTVAHTARHGLDTPNKFSIGTLMRPPQLYKCNATSAFI